MITLVAEEKNHCAMVFGPSIFKTCLQVEVDILFPSVEGSVSASQVTHFHSYKQPHSAWSHLSRKMKMLCDVDGGPRDVLGVLLTRKSDSSMFYTLCPFGFRPHCYPDVSSGFIHGSANAHAELLEKDTSDGRDGRAV